MGVNGTVYQLFIDLEKTYDSVRREVLYNIIIEFDIPMKIIRLIEVCFMKPIVKLKHVKICLMHLLFRIV
jgi:hypothetical protein